MVGTEERGNPGAPYVPRCLILSLLAREGALQPLLLYPVLLRLATSLVCFHLDADCFVSGLCLCGHGGGNKGIA